MIRRAIHSLAIAFVKSLGYRTNPELQVEASPWLDEESIGPMVLVVYLSTTKSILFDTAYTYSRRALADAVDTANLVSAAKTRFFQVVTRKEQVSFKEIEQQVALNLARKPSLAKEPYRVRALAIHNLLESEAAKCPEMLSSYADDLHVHDLACLEEARPGDTYAWILRRLGTHLVRVRPDHRADDVSLVATILNTFGGPHKCYIITVGARDGQLNEIPQEVLLTRLDAA